MSKNATHSPNKSPKKKKNNGLSKWLFGIFGVAFLALGLLGLVFWQTVMTPIKLTDTARIINVNEGDTYFKLIDKWQKKGLIKNAPIAKAYAKYFLNKPLQQGAYQLRKGDNLATVLQSFSNGKQAKMVTVRIIEGKRTQDLLNLLANAEGVKKEVSQLSKDEVLDTLSFIEEPHLEGLFAPNTYFYGQNTSDMDILEHLYNKQKEILAHEWQRRDKNLPYNNAYEALIMASIIEKETSIANERDMVAGVFVNRLRKGMKLQTDPTFIYGMGDRYKGDIRKKDLREKTPYNTYVIPALPPTPISLPSEASIKAALHPAETDALFFVATGTGGHKFTKTYAEHKKAVADYLQVMRNKK